MRGSCPRAGAIGGEAVAGKRGSFHPTAQIAVGRAESRSKAREGCAWRPPTNQPPPSPARRRRWLPIICRAGGAFGSKGVSQPGPRDGRSPRGDGPASEPLLDHSAAMEASKLPSPIGWKAAHPHLEATSQALGRHRASADRQAESRQEKVALTKYSVQVMRLRPCQRSRPLRQSGRIPSNAASWEEPSAFLVFPDTG